MNVKFLRDDIVQHYKGNYYKILFISKHTETEEQLISYQQCNCKGSDAAGVIWTRPASMFYEEVDGKPRFTKIEKPNTCGHAHSFNFANSTWSCDHPFAEECHWSCVFTDNQALCMNYKHFPRRG